MSLRTLMQAGPLKANELFARLADTSDGAIKTREKLFAELKAELELHTSLEEQHLFPVLRRNAETKELVVEAIKDNKALRAALVELEALPKNDEIFPERLKALQKVFRQHARDEKRELLPAVQHALSEEQVQKVTEKLEAGVAEAELARHEEGEARRAKARQERDEAARQAEQQEIAEQARKAAAEHARKAVAEQKRAKAQQDHQQAEREAELEAAAAQAEAEAEQQGRDLSTVAAKLAMAAQADALQVAQNATIGVQRMGSEIYDITRAASNVVRTMTPDLRSVTSTPGIAIDAMAEMRAAWTEWMSHTAWAGMQMSQDLVQQFSLQQRRFAGEAVQGWMACNARMMQITGQMAQNGLCSFTHRSAAPTTAARTGKER
jgi:hypothetical protein